MVAKVGAVGDADFNVKGSEGEEEETEIEEDGPAASKNILLAVLLDQNIIGLPLLFYICTSSHHGCNHR